MSDDFLWRHLEELPAFRALLRSVEARLYQDLLPLSEPILDVGCGDGHFASLTFPRPLTAGIDPALGVLREAHRRASYQRLAQALGDALPYATDTFATVISNSVLEHIPDLDPVLVEIARVLKPGGRFVFCVPSEQFARLLFFSQLFRRLHLERLARGYERTFNRISRHHHCDSPAIWQDRLVTAGLRLELAFYYFSEKAQHGLDLGHYFGAPSLIAKKLCGRWILAPQHWNLALTERWLRPLYEEPLPELGAYLFFVAEKA